MTVDIVVVGAGIVGLSTAATLLRQQDPPLSVAVVDRKVPCAGATGAGGSQCNLSVASMLRASWWRRHIVHRILRSMHAVDHSGQGYIWLAHRNIGDVAWELAKHSKARWQAMLDEPHRGSTYSQAVQWQVGVWLHVSDLECLPAACGMLRVNLSIIRSATGQRQHPAGNRCGRCRRIGDEGSGAACTGHCC